QDELSGLKELEIWQNDIKLTDVVHAQHQLTLELEGTFDFIVIATDVAGNETSEQFMVKISQSGIELDTVLKQVDNTAYADGEWTRQTVTASVYATHAQGVPLKPIQYSLNEGMTWK